jgi:hypothetical protein
VLVIATLPPHGRRLLRQGGFETRPYMNLDPSTTLGPVCCFAYDRPEHSRPEFMRRIVRTSQKLTCVPPRPLVDPPKLCFSLASGFASFITHWRTTPHGCGWDRTASQGSRAPFCSARRSRET